MKLCIADPPYLGRGVRLYGGGRRASFVTKAKGETANITNHPEAHIWDNPATHEDLVSRLCADYDGWAIAMAADNLRHYLAWVPSDARIAAWCRPNAFPTAGRVIPSWEPVVVRIPPERRKASIKGQPIRDYAVLNKVNTTVIGSKPPAWTRWVLDMLGYDDSTDTVDDLFRGSGAVAAEIAQNVLPLHGW